MAANGDGALVCGTRGKSRLGRLRASLGLEGVTLLALLLFAALTRSASAGTIDINTVIGFADTFRPGHWTPLTVTVNNSGEDLDGELEVQVGGDDALHGRELATLYRRALELHRDTRKSMQFLVRPQGLSRPLVIRVRAGAQELARAEVDLRTRFAVERLILVLSRDADLGYLNDGSVDGLRVLHPHPELLPTHWRGYDAVAAIVLHGIALERLSAGQYEALRKWVAHGGVFAVSGGADYSLLRSPRMAALLPATPVGMTRVGEEDLKRAFSSSLELGRPVHVNRVDNVRGQVRLRAGETPLIVEREFGLGRVLYLTFDVAGFPFDRWDGMRALWLETLRLPATTSGSTGAAEAALSDPLTATIAADGPGFPPYTTVFLFLSLYLGFLLAGYWIPARGSSLRRLGYLWHWVALAVFTPAAWFLFGPSAFPRGAAAATVALIEPLPNSPYARLEFDLGIYSNRTGTLRMEYSGAEPVLSPHRSTADQGQAPENWVFGPGSLPYVEMRDGRRYVLHELQGEDIIGFHWEASVHEDAAGPRVVLNNASGQTVTDLWLVFDGYGYPLGSVPAGSKFERRLARVGQGVALGDASWRHVLKTTLGAQAQALAAVQQVLERRFRTVGEQGYPGRGHALLIGYTTSPLRPAGTSAAWPLQERTVVAYRIAVNAHRVPVERAGAVSAQRHGGDNGTGAAPDPGVAAGRAKDDGTNDAE